MVFNESGKEKRRSAAIVIARVVNTTIIPKHQITAPLWEGGVVDSEDLDDLNVGTFVAATIIDNVMKLRKPVGLKQLRELRCVDGSNIVTSRVITAPHLAALIEKGEGTSE